MFMSDMRCYFCCFLVRDILLVLASLLHSFVVFGIYLFGCESVLLWTCEVYTLMGVKVSSEVRAKIIISMYRCHTPLILHTW